MEKRIEWLDFLKGLSIVLVVVGHLNTSIYIHNLIYNVHLFAFIFVSGIFFKNRKNINDLWKKDLRRIWLLFLFFSLLWIGFDYIYRYALYLLRDGEKLENIWKYILDALLAIILGNANLTGVSFGAVWYLEMLFSLKIIYYIFDKIVKRKEGSLTIICLCIFLCSVFWLNGCNKVPYYLTSAMSSLFIFHVGRLLKNRLINLENIEAKKLLLTMACTSVVYIGLVSLGGSVNLGNNSYASPGLVLPNMLLGITFLTCLSILLVRFNKIKRIFGYLGKNSLSIMGWHSEIKICILFLLSIIGVNNETLRNAIVLFATLILCMPLNRFTNKLITVINRSDKYLGGKDNG